MIKILVRHKGVTNYLFQDVVEIQRALQAAAQAAAQAPNAKAAIQPATIMRAQIKRYVGEQERGFKFIYKICIKLVVIVYWFVF